MSKVLPDYKTPYDPMVVMAMHRPGPLPEGFTDADFAASAALTTAFAAGAGVTGKSWLPTGVAAAGGMWMPAENVSYGWLCSAVICAARRFVAAKWSDEDGLGDDDDWDLLRAWFACMYTLWDEYGETMRVDGLTLVEAVEAGSTSNG